MVARCASPVRPAHDRAGGRTPVAMTVSGAAAGVAAMGLAAWLVQAAWTGGLTLRDLSEATACLFAF